MLRMNNRKYAKSAMGVFRSIGALRRYSSTSEVRFRLDDGFVEHYDPERG